MSERDSSRKEREKLLEDARSIYVCDSGCEGRCRLCPQDVVNRLIKALEKSDVE